uniref:DUF19 domain-containing protein n=1 Tax=Panagrolaimus sp. PS1159 TaxID=55785 RepID=A0AC35F1G0_9BILA
MFVKVAIVIVFSRFLQINGECSTDKTQQLTKCYNEYLSNLEHYDNIDSYEEYQISVSFYMENLTKVVVLCQNFNALSECIKNAKAEKCVNNNDFKAVKTIWNNNSTLFSTNYHTMNYMCGKGMKFLSPSYECLQLFRNNSVQCRIHSDDCLKRENEISCFSVVANSSCVFFKSI